MPVEHKAVSEVLVQKVGIVCVSPCLSRQRNQHRGSEDDTRLYWKLRPLPLLNLIAAVRPRGSPKSVPILGNGTARVREAC